MQLTGLIGVIFAQHSHAMYDQYINFHGNHVVAELYVMMLFDNGYFVALCPALDLTAYGDTEDEAQIAFEQTLDIFFKELVNHNALAVELNRLGWNIQDHHYSRPLSPSDYQSNIPYSIVGQQSKKYDYALA